MVTVALGQLMLPSVPAGRDADFGSIIRSPAQGLDVASSFRYVPSASSSSTKLFRLQVRARIEDEVLRIVRLRVSAIVSSPASYCVNVRVTFCPAASVTLTPVSPASMRLPRQSSPSRSDG